MKLDWHPHVKSYEQVWIPVVLVHYDLALEGEWRRLQKAWAASDYLDYSGWGRYERLRGRFRFPKGGQAHMKFAEAYAATLLEDAGFECRSAVQFFTYGKALRKEGVRKTNTAMTRERWPSSWVWPEEIRKHLVDPRNATATNLYRPRNPDLTAWNVKTDEWRFCEVKGRTDDLDADQLTALGVLHLITAAPVAIVHLVPEGHRVKSSKWLEPQLAEIRWKRDATSVLGLA